MLTAVEYQLEPLDKPEIKAKRKIEAQITVVIMGRHRESAEVLRVITPARW
jgi:hypothetical protein